MTRRQRSLLFKPTTGSCIGHLCDACYLCAKGKCCRRDAPDYRFPDVGDWDGPLYGDIGVARDDVDTMECHACGLWFASVANHAYRAHNLTAPEYRALFGLNRNTGLVSPGYGRRLSNQARRLIAEGRIVASPPTHTPEQQSQHLRGKSFRTQGKRAVRDGMLAAGIRPARTNFPRVSASARAKISAAMTGRKRPGTTQRLEVIAEMRTAGRTWREIGERLGYKDPSAPWQLAHRDIR